MTNKERMMNESKFQMSFIEMVKSNKEMLDSINKANENGFAVSFTIINGMVTVTFSEDKDGEAWEKLNKFRRDK